MLSFLVENESTRYPWSDYPEFLKSVDEIEERAGFDFMPDLSSDLEERIEGERPTEVW